MLAKYVRPDTILTIELHADVLPEHITWGVDMLLELGMGRAEVPVESSE
jgi:hypothetical protein